MIFISAPYSNSDQTIILDRYRETVAYSASLLNSGFLAFSPVVYGHNIALLEKLPADWEFWQKFCLGFLRLCTEMHVLMLPGWEESVGVQNEIKFAEKINIPIKYIKP